MNLSVKAVAPSTSAAVRVYPFVKKVVPMLTRKINVAKKAAPRKDRSHCLWTRANRTKGTCITNKIRSGIIW
jgi:hypothetical protein